MDIIIQGELYLKKHRDSYRTISVTPEMLFGDNAEDPNYLFNSMVKFGENNLIYQLIITKDGPKMRIRDVDGSLGPLFPIKFDVLDDEYIPLSDFLNEAQYIGRPAKITTSYHEKNKSDEGLLLYKGDSHIITYDFSKDDYLFRKKLPLQIYGIDTLSKVEVSGAQMDLYKDTSKLYSDLFREIMTQTKQNSKDKGNDRQKK